MTGVPNPWLPAGTVAEPTKPPCPRKPRATGPEEPQRFVPAPDKVDQLPTRQIQDSAATLWVLGAHGGAGESTIAALVKGWQPAGQAWPARDTGQPIATVVVARTNVRGLIAAKAAAKQWAAGLVPDVHLLGLILVSDAPGRLPRPLRDLMRVVSGGYPRVWQVPWIEPWRLGEPPVVDAAPREVRRLVDDLRTLLPQGASSGATIERN